MFSYFAAYKPFHTLTQFSASAGKKILGDYFPLPRDVYPVGRLDYDSEGLIILTNDPSLNQRLLNPRNKHEREYLVQVEGIVDPGSLERLRSGLTITIDGRPYHTLPCRAHILKESPRVAPRIPPIRFRKNVPTSWLRLILHEGKNRQVRRMTAKLGFPTLRLIRWRIGNLALDNMLPGDYRKFNREQILSELFGPSGM